MEKPDTRPADDPQALAALFEAYASRVLLYMQYRCDDLPTAQDLAGQVFEQIVKSLPDYDPQRAPAAAWVFSIARHVAAGWLRRQYLRKFLSWDDFFRHPSPGPGPEQTAIESEERRALRAALRELSGRERDLIALRFSSGLTNRQIAALTGLSESNVAVVLYRALRKLRERLALSEDIRCASPACLMEVDDE